VGEAAYTHTIKVYSQTAEVYNKSKKIG